MFSPLLPISAAIFCLGCVIELVHQQNGNPGASRWIDYLALAIISIGAIGFIIGASLSS